ncbi:Elongator subunit elp4, partial [Nowakowskiella sp. JEL0078]
MNGTKVSVVTSKWVVSTGVASFDDILFGLSLLLGGGLPLNSLLLVKEDRLTGYSYLLLKYFLSQGLAIDNIPTSKHHILIAAADDDPSTILGELMGLANSSQTTEKDDDGDDEDVDLLGNALLSSTLSQPTTRTLGAVRDADKMQIAWRYQTRAKVNLELAATSTVTGTSSSFRKGVRSSEQGTTQTGPYSHIFDLTKRMPVNDNDRITLVDLRFDESITRYQRLYSEIESKLKSESFSHKSGNSNVLRIAISSFGSCMWTNGDLVKDCARIYSFLQKLKLLLRQYAACCFVTFPAYLYEDMKHLERRLEHIADACIEVESLSGTSNFVNPAYTALNYHGLIHTLKLPIIHGSLMSPLERKAGLDRRILAFKCRRKRFAIETIQIPVEEEELDEIKNLKKGVPINNMNL